MYFVDLGFTWVPTHQFSLNLDLRWKKRNNWLVHQSAGEMSGFDAIDLAPSMSMDFFVSRKAATAPDPCNGLAYRQRNKRATECHYLPATSSKSPTTIQMTQISLFLGWPLNCAIAGR